MTTPGRPDDLPGEVCARNPLFLVQPGVGAPHPRGRPERPRSFARQLLAEAPAKARPQGRHETAESVVRRCFMREERAAVR